MPRRRIKRFGPPRNPILDNVTALDDFIVRGFAAGKSMVQMMSEVLPSVEDELHWKAERIRADNEAASAKRLARIAARNDPGKRERERQRFQARMRAHARKQAARQARLEREAAARKAALAENPTLRWRTPRNLRPDAK